MLVAELQFLENETQEAPLAMMSLFQSNLKIYSTLDSAFTLLLLINVLKHEFMHTEGIDHLP